MNQKSEENQSKIYQMLRFLAIIGEGERKDLYHKRVGISGGGKHAGGWRGHKAGIRRQNKTAN